MNLVCLTLFAEATRSHSFMKFWLKVSFGPGWNMKEPDFRHFDHISTLTSFDYEYFTDLSHFPLNVRIILPDISRHIYHKIHVL